VGEATAPNPAHDDLVGVTFGHCLIEELLGEGGMARVYRARQENLDRNVAIKVLPLYYAADPAFVERFQLEAKAMAKLSHPNIVTIHDAGEERGRLFIIMEFVAGGNLKDRMTPTLPLSETTRVIRDVASALSYAHERHIVHRDVKPVNVLVDSNGRIVLSDFGIAKVLASSNVVTRTGAGVGTPEYMSPEQCRGAHVDGRSDIYALGVMLYEMLTGHTPFEADSYTALAHSHIYEPVPPPSRFNPRISLAVQAVILKALEKDPVNRFQHATDMAQTLEMAVAAQMPVGPGYDRSAAGGRVPTPAGAPPLVPCPRCGATNPAQQRFCSSCGMQLRPGGTAGPAAQRMPGGTPEGQVGCPHCHQLNRATNRYCTRCGQPLIGAASGLFCRACGTQNAPGTRFCTRCGQPLT
jgi:serine/threonine-protein kinase